MVTVPAKVWRGGSVRRGLVVGLGAGLFFGALAWLDSGLLIAGVAVLVILGVAYGIWMARRMARYWPAAEKLSGDERVTVVRAARRGEPISEPQLAQAVIDYSEGLHAAAEKARPFRWILWFVLTVAVLAALWDTVFGSVRDGVASGVYLALLGIEMFWWPKRQQQLLADADRSAEIAERLLEQARLDQERRA